MSQRKVLKQGSEKLDFTCFFADMLFKIIMKYTAESKRNHALFQKNNNSKHRLLCRCESI